MHRVAKIFLIAIVIGGLIAPAHLAVAQVPLGEVNTTNGFNTSQWDGVCTPGLKDAVGLGSFDFQKCVQLGIAMASYMGMWLVSKLLSITGVLLNLSIHYSIVDMRATINGTGGINTAWSAIRDLANITFIFVLLYAAIGTILQLSGVNMRKMVMSVIVVALLINFSMFFTKVVIDASNIFALSVYEQIGGKADFDATDIGSWNTGLSRELAAAMGVTTFFNPGQAKDLADAGLTAIIINGLAGSTLMLVGAFVMCAMAVMFIIRFVILIFVMILSPLAFISYALPAGMIQHYAKQWKDALFSQALFAPMFMILMWIVLTVLTEAPATLSNLTEAGVGEGVNELAKNIDKGAIDYFFKYGIAMAFLIGAFVISKQVASSAGGMAAGWINKGSSAAGAAMFGGGAYLGRRFIGKDAAKEAEEFKNKASRFQGQKGLRAFAARNYYKGLGRMNEGIAKRSFDVRASGLGKALGAGNEGVFGVGDVRKGGYVAYKKDKEDINREWLSRKKEVEAREKIDRASGAESELTRAQEDLRNLNATISTQPTGPTATQRTEQARLQGIIDTSGATLGEAQKALQNLSEKDLKNALKENKIGIEFAARYLSPQKFAASIMRNDDIDEAKKDKAVNARFQEMRDHIDTLNADTSALETVKSAIAAAGGVATVAQATEKARLEAKTKKAKELAGRLSVQDMEYIDQSYLSKPEFASNVSQGVSETITKPDNYTLTNNLKREFSDARLKPTKDALTSSSPGYTSRKAKEALFRLDSKAAARLDISLLTNPDVLEAYNPDKLNVMANEMDESKRTALRAAILNAHLNPTPPPATWQTKMRNYFTSGKGALLYS